jgi:hypothetical protein
MENRNATARDPLGLAALAAAVEALRAAALEGPKKDGDAVPALTARLDAAHREFAVRMELLRDRYSLLKSTSAQLAEEVAWLRDQLDDLSCAGEPDDPGPAGGSDQRRYVDRHPGARRG